MWSSDLKGKGERKERGESERRGDRRGEEMRGERRGKRKGREEMRERGDGGFDWPCECAPHKPPAELPDQSLPEYGSRDCLTVKFTTLYMHCCPQFDECFSQLAWGNRLLKRSSFDMLKL